jgi:hypothetical protein
MSDKLRPGESRIVRHDPAPFPDWYSFPNEYHLLGRAASRMVERNWITFLNGGERRQALLAALDILRELRLQMPSKPIKNWERFGLGIVREICCPACEIVSEHKGNFYQPSCPNCKAQLVEREFPAEHSSGAAPTGVE